MESRVPVAAVGGFLGAGKTSLINHVLSRVNRPPTAVIVNEFGALGIDGRLIRRASGGIVELNNGCVCCEVREDLGKAVHTLLKQRRRWIKPARFDEIWIELSGLAKPGPVVQTFQVQPELLRQCEWKGVVTVVHSGLVVGQMDEFQEALEQVAVADVLLLNHSDRVSADEMRQTASVLREVNPVARQFQAERGRIDDDMIFPGSPSTSLAYRPALHDGHHTHADVQCIVLSHDTSIDLYRLKMFLQFISGRYAGNLLRLKGLFRCGGQAVPVLAHGIYQWLEFGPTDGLLPTQSQLVLIGRDLNGDEIHRGWEKLVD